MKSDRKRPPVRPPFSRLAAVLSGLVVAIVLAELGLRLPASTLPLPPSVAQLLAAPRLPLPYDTTAIDQLQAGGYFMMFDAELGWVPRPGEYWGGGVRYRNNRGGLRADREYTPAPGAGIRRVAAYGDSFTYCLEGDIADCWTRTLEARLPNTEVLNFGVPVYGPDQAWLRYQRDGAGWRPCAVLISHLVENINRIVNRFRVFYVPGPFLLAKPRYIQEGDRLVLLPSPARRVEDLRDPAWVETHLGPHDAWYFPGTFVANPLDRLELVRLVRTAAYKSARSQRMYSAPGWAERMYRPGSEAFEVLTRVLVGFAEQVRADGATPVVVVHPLSREIAARRDEGPKLHAPLLTVLQQHGIPTIDLTDALGEEARRTSLAELLRVHYLPPGNAVVARTLADQLPRLTAATCGDGLAADGVPPSPAMP